MKPKALIETNPYFAKPRMREKLTERSVITSAGVEGIKINADKLSAFENKIMK